MTRCVSIYKVLGLWALIVFLTGCAAEKEPLIVSPLSQDFMTEPTMPTYPGGTEKMFEFIADNLRWPDDDACIQGRVVVSFIVEKDGSLTDVKVTYNADLSPGSLNCSNLWSEHCRQQHCIKDVAFV